MNGFHQIIQKQEDFLTVGCRPVVKEPLEVKEEGVVSQVVELLPFRREVDLEATSVVGMGPAPHEAFRELIDDAGHRAELDLKLRGKLAHRLRTVKVETAQAIGLGDGQRAVGRCFLAPELIEKVASRLRASSRRSRSLPAFIAYILRYLYYSSHVVFNSPTGACAIYCW